MQDLIPIKARKTQFREIRSKFGVPADKLSPITGVRKLKNRQSGQYKIIDENNKELNLRNFNDLKFFSNQVLRGQHKHLILIREDRLNGN